MADGRAYPIVDLHCDLLDYLYYGDAAKTFTNSSEIGCSLPKLREGNVAIQIMPIYTDGEERYDKDTGIDQARIFGRLLSEFSGDLVRMGEAGTFDQLAGGGKIGVAIAVENASALCMPDEPFGACIDRIKRIEEIAGRIAYIGPTWNNDNRFGGGIGSALGLTSDGERLLDHMGEKGIPVDVSHSSDALRCDIASYIDSRRLGIKIMASHSAFRGVLNIPRNLPDDGIEDIVKRSGVIGFNMISAFVGMESKQNIARNFAHALALGAGDALAFGADFFYLNSVHPKYVKTKAEMFFDGFDDASMYPRLIDFLRDELRLSEDGLRAISHMNAVKFLRGMFPNL
jgi:microsomal dipeptidase-like Zn-dependent dipeptidase